MDDEESDSSDSFVVAFEAHHLQTLEKVSGEKEGRCLKRESQPEEGSRRGESFHDAEGVILGNEHRSTRTNREHEM